MKPKRASAEAGAVAPVQPIAQPSEPAFEEVVAMIEQARRRAAQAANVVVVDLYWQIGEYLARRIETDGWGKGTVEALSAHVQRKQPGVRGFSPQNLWRMRQFFETWHDYPKLSTRLREVPWSGHLLIMGRAKSVEERDFYLRIAGTNKWPVRELERQMAAALFERAVLNPPKLSTRLRELHPQAQDCFRDAYSLEFLSLPAAHSESDLHSALLRNLGRFLAELGRDFCFPSIGVLLCASKDNEVVEYALSRSLSPALIAEYQTQLPDKKLLAAKLHEFYAMNEPSETDRPKRKDGRE